MRNRNGIVAILYLMAVFCVFPMKGEKANFVVADSASHFPLPSASVFDRRGSLIGLCGSKGISPRIPRDAYPLSIRFLGFQEARVDSLMSDTVFMRELTMELPEVLIESRAHRALHMLAYVREYSTLTTYADTVFLFREKMVDFIIPQDKNGSFAGWTNPRVLKSKSYYRFSNSEGLDSVSDESRHHFSWSDWIGISETRGIAPALTKVESGSDTIRGKYSPAEIWNRRKDKISVDINVLADTASRKWVPNLRSFFKKDLDFENFRVRYNYENVVDDSLRVTDLAGYSFNIESNGRGRDMFRFNRKDEPFFVSTYAEVYVLDREYITMKEAKKWASRKLNLDDVEIIEPEEAPDLSDSILQLIARVESVNKDEVRLDFVPDSRMMSERLGGRNFKIGRRALLLLKQMTGITYFRSHRNIDRNWNEFRQDRRQKNSGNVSPD